MLPGRSQTVLALGFELSNVHKVRQGTGHSTLKTCFCSKLISSITLFAVIRTKNWMLSVTASDGSDHPAVAYLQLGRRPTPTTFAWRCYLCSNNRRRPMASIGHSSMVCDETEIIKTSCIVLDDCVSDQDHVTKRNEHVIQCWLWPRRVYLNEPVKHAKN